MFCEKCKWRLVSNTLFYSTRNPKLNIGFRYYETKESKSYKVGLCKRCVDKFFIENQWPELIGYRIEIEKFGIWKRIKRYLCQRKN